MANGADEHNGDLSPYGNHSTPNGIGGQNSSTEATVVKLDIGLTGRQIYMGLVGLAGTLTTILGGFATAGWLSLPAKDSDLQSLKQVVEIIRADQAASRDVVTRLTLAVDNLAQIVERTQGGAAGKTRR